MGAFSFIRDANCFATLCAYLSKVVSLAQAKMSAGTYAHFWDTCVAIAMLVSQDGIDSPVGLAVRFARYAPQIDRGRHNP